MLGIDGAIKIVAGIACVSMATCWRFLTMGVDVAADFCRVRETTGFLRGGRSPIGLLPTVLPIVIGFCLPVQARSK